MIVKKRDAQFEVIRALDEQAELTNDKLKRSACISAASRLRADSTTQRATELIDFHFGQSEKWAVIHDLRLRIGGHAVQINHLLIDDALRVVCMDSRFLSYGIELGSDGQCMAMNSIETRVIASPLNKMAKDVRMMRGFLEGRDWSPSRFGMRQKPTVCGFVLTNPDIEQAKFRSPSPDMGVFQSEAIIAKLLKRQQQRAWLNTGKLSAEALLDVAKVFVDEHMPIFPEALLLGETERVVAT